MSIQKKTVWGHKVGRGFSRVFPFLAVDAIAVKSGVV